MADILYLLWTFFGIGACTFGGGYAMVELVSDRVVTNGWMEMAEVIDFIAISESTPGPIAINMATFVGYRVAGIWGSIAATIGVVLPSLIVIMIIARFYKQFIVNPYVAGTMKGLRPAAIALIGAAGISFVVEVFVPDGLKALSLASLITPANGFALITLVLCMYLVFKKAKPFYILILSGACGIIWGAIQELFLL